MATRATTAPTSSPSAACSTRCSRDARRSRAPPPHTVIAAIVSSEPPPIAALQSAHPHLDHVLRRCLEKDRERRWQSIGDVTGELRWIAEQSDRGAGRSRSPSAATPARPSRVGRLAMAFALLLAGAAVAVAVSALRGPRAAPDLPALTLEVSTAPTDDPSTALSVDGTQLAFIANRDRVPVVWVRALDAGESRPLPGTEGASFPFWSPDGRSLGFFANDKLKRIDVAGGVPLVVADAPNARGGTWNADGVILFAPGVAAPIVRVPARGGPVEARDAAECRQRPGASLAAVLARRQTVPVLVDARHRGNQRRVSRLARQDAAGAPGAGRHRRPLRRARQAADDQAGGAAGVHVQRRVRHRAWANRSSSRRASPARPRTPCLPRPTPVCWPTVPAPRSAGSWCGSIGRAPCCARLASRTRASSRRRS